MTPARRTPAAKKPPPPDEVYLRRQRDLILVTAGRRTARPHRVTLWFASAPGRIFLMAYARRHGRGTDWYQNLHHAGAARVDAGDRQYEARIERVTDSDAALAEITELFAAKYGRQMVNSYYRDTKRHPVHLRVTPTRRAE